MIDPQLLQPVPKLTLARAALAVSSSLLATALTVVMMSFLEQNIFLLFLIAVLVSSLTGGLWTGLVAALISVLGVIAVAFEPVGSLAIDDSMDVMRVISFAVFGVVVAVLAQALISARRRSEQRARDAAAGEESFRELFHSIADAIYVYGPTGRLLNVNHAATALHGMSRQEMLGLGWDQLVDPSLTDVAALREALEGAFGGETQSLEAWTRSETGRSVPVEARITAARYFDRDVVLIVARPLTERHRLEEQLRQSQKMEAVGRLAGGVAHDFNNLLTSVRGYASLMRDRVEHDASLREDLGEIEHAVDLGTAITRQLLAFSRKQEYRAQPVSLNDSLDRMDRLLRRLIGEHVDLVIVKDPDLGVAMLDEGQIEQVVMNLTVNARDALENGGHIQIRTRNIDAVSPPGRYVVLSVEDDGSGMDEGTRARLFEPFFTTKASGHGTGLGLSTVYGIVRQSGGHIEVETAPGAGTTFAVMFPRVDDVEPTLDTDVEGDDLSWRAEAAAAPAAPVRAAGNGSTRAAAGSLTVLLAEDEPAVRNLVRRILSRQGYAVIDAENGRAAMDALHAYDGPVDALVTDVIMPEMGGPELAERVRAERPELPVLFTSGYNEEGMEGTGIVEGLGIAFLQKPFVPDELVRLLGELLDDVAARS